MGHPDHREVSQGDALVKRFLERDQVIGPILAGVRSPRQGRKPAHWTRLDRDYEALRIQMQTLFADFGLATAA